MRPRARRRTTPRPLRVPPTTTAGTQATGGELVRFSAYTGSGAWRRHSNPGASCLSLAGGVIFATYYRPPQASPVRCKIQLDRLQATAAPDGIRARPRTSLCEYG